MDFRDKVVLITGAAGGIGAATAAAFNEQGATLVLVDLSDTALETVATDLALAEENSLLLAADVSDEQQVAGYVLAALDKFGKIDVFINNAGVEGKTGALVDTDSATVDAILNVNVKGTFFGIKHVMASMIARQSGAIVNTASVAGVVGFPGLGVYTASKHAVVGLTRVAAMESAANGVRVNAICPGPVNTRMMRGIESGMSADNPEGVAKEFAESVGIKRYAEPEEIAQVMLFLASDKASYVTGSIYTVDGGQTQL
jgi:meso-butanediol dehydrogenase/(S,S)-butanediol dehydrogenase/diacetyl reductase